ncbi:hypothetical protein [Alsobacter sp. R-9]
MHLQVQLAVLTFCFAGNAGSRSAAVSPEMDRIGPDQSLGTWRTTSSAVRVDLADTLHDPYRLAVRARLIRTAQMDPEALAAEPEADSRPKSACCVPRSLPELCRCRVAELESVLEGPDRAETMDLIRWLIEQAAGGQHALAGASGVECRGQRLRLGGSSQWRA